LLAANRSTKTRDGEFRCCLAGRALDTRTPLPYRNGFDVRRLRQT
jgi:hypothetical protein